MQHLHKVNSLEDMRLIAKEVVLHLDTFPIVLLKGELGAGKTTLAQMIGEMLGITEPITSPTYTIVNVYELENRTIYHFDLYRLNHAEELHGIGFGEYLDSGNICLIEWPEIAAEYLNDMQTMEVNIYKKEEGREIIIQYHTITA